ncbi:hypothetical protein ACFW96_28890 [Streptomyces gardneri]
MSRAEDVDGIHVDGTGWIYLANVIGSQQRFIVFLTEDLTRSIACM